MVLTSLCLGGVWLALPALAQSKLQRPIVIKFSHVVTPDTAKGKAASRFKELAERMTGGRVRVDLYPDNQLYQDREELTALTRGTVQMLAPSLSKLADLGGGDFEAFDLPFLFKDSKGFRAVVEGPIGDELLRKLEPRGVKGLAFWDNGVKVFTANKPLHVPDDIRGLRFRVQASKVLSWQMESLGARASAMPLLRVKEALNARELDGQENTPSNIYTQGLYEVQSHMTLSNHGYLAYAVIANKPFWDNLPPDIRTLLEAAMRESTAYAYTLAEAENKQALEHISASGKLTIYTPTAAEMAQWRNAMAPTYDKAKGRVQPATLAAIRKALGVPP